MSDMRPIDVPCPTCGVAKWTPCRRPRAGTGYLAGTSEPHPARVASACAFGGPDAGLPLDADGKWRGVIDDPGLPTQPAVDQFDPREHGHQAYHRWCGKCRRLGRRFASAQTPWWGV